MLEEYGDAYTAAAMESFAAKELKPIGFIKEVAK